MGFRIIAFVNGLPYNNIGYIPDVTSIRDGLSSRRAPVSYQGCHMKQLGHVSVLIIGVTRCHGFKLQKRLFVSQQSSLQHIYKQSRTLIVGIRSPIKLSMLNHMLLLPVKQLDLSEFLKGMS